MFGYKKELKALEERKIMLEKQNTMLRSKIAETKDITVKNDDLWNNKIEVNRYGGLRGGQYGIMRNLPNFEEWKDTVFWMHRDELIEKNGWTLKRLPEREIVGNDMIKPEWNYDFDFNIIAFCDMVMPTSNGPIVHIIDPFGEYTLPPAKMVTNSDAQKLTGYVISVTCIMRYYQKDYEVVGFEKLPYTMYNKMA